MDLITIKSTKDLSLAGITHKFIIEDNNVVAVELTDVFGNFCIIKHAGNYSGSIKVMIPAPPKMVDMWFVTGKFMGMTDVNEGYIKEYEARNRLREYQQRGDTSLEIEMRSVHEDEYVKIALNKVG